MPTANTPEPPNVDPPEEKKVDPPLPENPPPVAPADPLPPMPENPEERRVMLDYYAGSHESLTPEQVEFHDELATQVAVDEDEAQNEIGKDPDVNPPEVVAPEATPFTEPHDNG